MLTCRFKSYKLGQGTAHVHDEPGYLVDALRCLANGWKVWVDNKCHVEGPFTLGDSKPSFNHTLDLVKRPILSAADHKERARFYGGI